MALFEVSDNTPGEVTLTFSDEIDSTYWRYSQTHSPQSRAAMFHSRVWGDCETKPKPNPIPVYVPTLWWSTPSTSDTVAAFQRAFSARVTYYGVDCWVVIWTVPVKDLCLQASEFHHRCLPKWQLGPWYYLQRRYYILSGRKTVSVLYGDRSITIPFQAMGHQANQSVASSSIAAAQSLVITSMSSSVARKSSGVRHAWRWFTKGRSCGSVSGCYNWNTKDHLPAINGTKVFFNKQRGSYETKTFLSHLWGWFPTPRHHCRIVLKEALESQIDLLSILNRVLRWTENGNRFIEKLKVTLNQFWWICVTIK